MVLEDNEKRFEQDIESFLLSKKGGYIKGDMSTFDKKKALDMAKLIEFISSNTILNTPFTSYIFIYH